MLKYQLLSVEIMKRIVLKRRKVNYRRRPYGETSVTLYTQRPVLYAAARVAVTNLLKLDQQILTKPKTERK